MSGGNYYLVTSLPSLGELGEEPPLTLAELREKVQPNPSAARLVDAVLLSDDLLQREALLAGEQDDSAPAVLSAEQMRDEEPLPGFLAKADENAPVAVDAIWAAYFHNTADLAEQASSDFLGEWVRYEVSLRNALAEARAKALDLDPTDYTVTEELEGLFDFDQLLNEWANAENPLVGLQILDQARWRWLHENDRWFSFADDELAAYAAKLVLMERWHRLSKAQHADEQTEPTQA